MLKKKKVRFTDKEEEEEEEGKDRISNFPDELIHHILSFIDASLAVRTSVLSKRWKLIWTTLPVLNFTKDGCEFLNTTLSGIKFTRGFLTNRDYKSHVVKLNFAYQFRTPLAKPFITYAILRYVQELNFDVAVCSIKLSSFSSTSIKKLTLTLYYDELVESDCWDLPALTGLHLIHQPRIFYKLPESYLICLPSLRNLLLDGFELPDSITLPALTTLYLGNCKLSQKVWDFPALLNLTLDDVSFPRVMLLAKFFQTLVNLKNLVLFFRKNIMTDCFITCPQLVNLEINACISTTLSGMIIVFAPKIRNFSSVGFFPIISAISELENVNIKLRGTSGDETIAPFNLRGYYGGVIRMFPGLGNARILTLDSETIEALSSVSNLVVHFPSPFYNLKYVKVPRGYNESSISTDLKRYLLGRSPKATIVSALPQDELIPQMLPVCLRPQNLLPEKPLATQVAGAGNDRASSSEAHGNFGLWRGHEVSSEFLGLLDCIAKKYPETFDYFTTNSKKLCTMKLNMLCTTVKAFTKTSMTEVDTEMIVEYRAQFADLQRSFNVKWLVNRLNYIEQLQFSQPLLDKLHALDSGIDDAKSKLQALQALRVRTVTEIHRDIGTMDTSNDVGYIGDDLFSGP